MLCRSLEIWREIDQVNLPGDIRPLIEQTYVNRPEKDEMAKLKNELENGSHRRIGTKAMHQLAMVSLAGAGKTMSDNRAQTRYSETDNFEVLLLGGLTLHPDDKTSRLTLLDGEHLTLPWEKHALTKHAWRKLSVRLMRQVVPVRVQDAPLQQRIATLEKYGFQHCFYLGNPAHDDAILRVALVDEAGGLQPVQGNHVHEKFPLEYRDDLGYRVIKS